LLNIFFNSGESATRPYFLIVIPSRKVGIITGSTFFNWDP